MKRIIFMIFIWFLTPIYFAQGTFEVAVLKYNGGGDYYANPTSVPNLISYYNTTFSSEVISNNVPFIEAGSKDIFQYPFIHMTGHGNVVFNKIEALNLRTYLLSGGFLHIDDNYGMDEFIRKELKKIFPQKALIELPPNHIIFDQKFKFNGLPKIHEHDGKRAQAFAIIENGRIICLYTYETDLGDGWEDASVHNDSEKKREEALQMGCNILMYAFTQ